MNQLKTRLQALSLLDRALTAMTDEELTTLVASLPDDHRTALDRLCGARDEEGFTDSAARTLAIRSTAARGRMNGGLEQIATILTDPSLAECIEGLGEHADNPTEEQLQELIPGLIEAHGLGTVRLMIAGSIAGEAAATPMLTRLLKSDAVLALPPEERVEPVVLPPSRPDDELRARRKTQKDAKRADARARREQQLRAKHRV